LICFLSSIVRGNGRPCPLKGIEIAMVAGNAELYRYVELIERRVPARVATFIWWLREPSAFWVRLICGGAHPRRHLQLFATLRPLDAASGSSSHRTRRADPAEAPPRGVEMDRDQVGAAKAALQKEDVIATRRPIGPRKTERERMRTSTRSIKPGGLVKAGGHHNQDVRLRHHAHAQRRAGCGQESGSAGSIIELGRTPLPTRKEASDLD
jgi:hypothetical protein